MTSIHHFKALLDAFSNWGLDEEDREKLNALADYTTNTFRVYEPASNPVAMTIIHAFVSREEFMHGDWDTALVYSCARLRIAAIDLFLDLLLSPDEDTAARLQRVMDIWTTAAEIDQPIEPFQEAVDKIQILSIVAGEEPFYENVQEKFESEYGPDAVADYHDTETELSEVLRKEVETQRAIARGEKTVDLKDRSNLYVNPLYVYALASITDERVERNNPDDDIEIELQQLSQQRLIAEAVAKVTLDIPYPIAPLGPDADEAGLAVDGLDVDPISLEELQTQTGDAAHYDVDQDDYEQYLLTHLSRIENEELKQELGPTADEYEPTWLDAVFVSTLKKVDELQEAGELPSDPATLRRRLSREVHKVDTEHPDTETMADRPTHLQDIPKKASRTDINNDYITETGEPMPKIILEAFEQHGSFGAVIFRPTQDDTGHVHEMNFHAVIEGQVDEHPDVPSGVESYEELWNHYFVGKEVINTFWTQAGDYREALIDAFVEAYDSPESLGSALEDVEPELSRDPSTTPEFDTPLSSGRGSFNRAKADAQAKGYFGESAHTRRMRDQLSDWTIWDLRAAARLLDIEYPSVADADLSDFQCPLCELVETPCGNDACAFERVSNAFSERWPVLLEERLKIEARSSGRL